jgi:hypothetical protein
VFVVANGCCLVADSNRPVSNGNRFASCSYRHTKVTLPEVNMKIKVFTTVDSQVVEQIDAVAKEIGGTRADALRLIIRRGLSNAAPSAAHPPLNEMLRLILRETVYIDFYLRAICDLKDLQKVPGGRQIRADAEEEFARLIGGLNEEKAD